MLKGMLSVAMALLLATLSTVADPSYAWDYQQHTGITICTEHKGSIPYVTVCQGEDLFGESFEYIQEQYTPHMQRQYGEDMVSYEEFEDYETGGRHLPAGLYTCRLQGYLVDMLRLYDSTGAPTVAYTAEYIQGQEEVMLAALDAAVRGFKAS